MNRQCLVSAVNFFRKHTALVRLTNMVFMELFAFLFSEGFKVMF